MRSHHTLGVFLADSAAKPPSAFSRRVSAGKWRLGRSATSVALLPPFSWPTRRPGKARGGDIAAVSLTGGNMQLPDRRLQRRRVAIGDTAGNCRRRELRRRWPCGALAQQSCAVAPHGSAEWAAGLSAAHMCGTDNLCCLAAMQPQQPSCWSPHTFLFMPPL